MPELTFDNQLWEQWIRKVYIPQIGNFSQAMEQRVLASFENIKKEAEDLREQKFLEIGHIWNSESDPSGAYEIANDTAKATRNSS